MPTNPKDPALADHLAWLGYVQPEGLVVSAPALVDAQAVIDRAQLGELQRRLAGHVADLPLSDSDTAETRVGITDLPRFFTEFLGWQPDLVRGWDPAHPLPESLAVVLPEFQETLRPTYAVTNPQPKEGASPWLLLVQAHLATVNLDRPAAGSERGWHASPAKKFERLLRGTQVPIGLLTNGTEFRLIYAPPKENSGALTFPVGAMAEISGRLILGAFHLLLNSWTLFNAPSDARLPSLLQRSRDYQASVSEKLAAQVLHALYELLRGFEAADERAKGALLRQLAAQHPEQIYGGLVTVLLRLVFVLFAEDRGLLPTGGFYVNHYAVRGLFERLRVDAERYPDTMDHRFGAWAQLLALFRLIHGGCQHHELKMPAREGHLFDPDRYPFLEGRAQCIDPVGALPLVSDGVLHRILEKLCILDGERVSYRTLDVEEIGSVYQTIMGFEVEAVRGTAIALKGKRKKGSVPAAPVVDLAALLAEKPADRMKMLMEQADTKLTGDAERRLKEAATAEDLLVVLDKRIDRHATPAPVAPGGLVLQPNDERRRSGSHYTPRSFTEPIVRKTLAPVLARLGDPPTPEQILDLKIADIAVGSAAFLVEACRQLGDALVRAWRVHGDRPPVPPDETEELLAMRLVAQRCLYGVDRNPMAVDLAKLSLWLATLAKDHPFTFLDHNLRCGDSLVGLTQRQIEAFTWEEKTAGRQRVFGQDFLEKRIQSATAHRREILKAGDYVPPAIKAQKLRLADEALDEVRFAGDLIIAAFFAADKDKARRAQLDTLRDRYVASLTTKPYDPALKPRDAVAHLRAGNKAVWPFHWQVEFPEVFGGERNGFDAIVGNPPFMGGTQISEAAGMNYFQWLVANFPPCEHHCDLVAYFFRKGFATLRNEGSMGLIATKTIRQGDTREGGLLTILKSGGTIYSATRRYRWPGQAAVVVSVVHISKELRVSPVLLDGEAVERISAYLFAGTDDESPKRLVANPYFSLGSKIYGQGFLFADDDLECTPISMRDMILAAHPGWINRIPPYLVGEEINTDPNIRPQRFVISLNDVADEAGLDEWPELKEIVMAKVKPERLSLGNNPNNVPLKKKWWAYQAHRPELYSALATKQRALCLSRVGQALAFAFAETGIVYSEAVVVFDLDSNSAFAAVQSRPHEMWARFRRIVEADSPAKLKASYGVKETADTVGHPLADAYLFFHEQIADWMGNAEPAAVTRATALFTTLREKLLLVVIDLDKHDDAQVIFESLNARGTPLLPADLIKNLLFHRLRKEGENIEKIYEKEWRYFDTEENSKYWREKQGRGHASRARIDLFLQNYLSARKCAEVPTAHLFTAFREFVDQKGPPPEEKRPSPLEHLQSIRRYAEVYRSFDTLDPLSREAAFFSRIRTMEMASVYPFVLELFVRFSESRPHLLEVLEDIESFLVRRMVCGLNTRGYNRLFVDLLKTLQGDAPTARARLRAALLPYKAQSNRWPDDKEFGKAWRQRPTYQVLNQPRIRLILEALDAALRTSKTEAVQPPAVPDIEHLMPQEWPTNWPLPSGIDPAAATEVRNVRLHNIGNLTLLTEALNSSISNGPWDAKRQEILKFSARNLNRTLPEVWDEEAIAKRAEALLNSALAIWPYPN